MGKKKDGADGRDLEKRERDNTKDYIAGLCVRAQTVNCVHRVVTV